MEKIAVDTSFLIFMIKRKIEINRINELFNKSISFYTSEGVINELKHIAESNKNDSVFATLAIEYINKKKFEIIKNNENPDDWLIKQKIIATVDMPLSKKSIKNGVSVINITKSNKIVLR